MLSINSHKKALGWTIPLSLIALVLLSGFLFIRFHGNESKVSALSVADFNPGRIIDDSIFTDTATMNVVQIQAFLNSKVPVCDTLGAQQSEYGGGTRSQWGLANYNQSTFICLKDYSENGKSAAQIINDAAQQYQINPQVILVLLQKEQGLVTDTWPLNLQYKTATGYGCPDTAACDSQYFGLTNQINWSAKMFRAIMNGSPTWYTPYILGTNYIQYNPDTRCGGTSVLIEDKATQALYNYTPYQPNNAVLSWKLGSGSSVSSAYPGCGAFGNINFFTYFNNWFGRTTLDCRPDEQASTGVMRLYNPITYKHFYTSYQCEAKTLSTKNGFQLEGTAFYGTTASSQYAVVVHRLYNPITFQHLWVTTQDEINSATQRSGYVYEGIAFYAVKPELQGSIVVHRLYNPKTYEHLWLTTQAEIDSATKYSGYVYEGPAFWAAPQPVVPQV